MTSSIFIIYVRRPSFRCTHVVKVMSIVIYIYIYECHKKEKAVTMHAMIAQMTCIDISDIIRLIDSVIEWRVVVIAAVASSSSSSCNSCCCVVVLVALIVTALVTALVVVKYMYY